MNLLDCLPAFKPCQLAHVHAPACVKCKHYSVVVADARNHSPSNTSPIVTIIVKVMGPILHPFLRETKRPLTSHRDDLTYLQ